MVRQVCEQWELRLVRDGEARGGMVISMNVAFKSGARPDIAREQLHAALDLLVDGVREGCDGADGDLEGV